jgi:hypothetical protein
MLDPKIIRPAAHGRAGKFARHTRRIIGRDVWGGRAWGRGARVGIALGTGLLLQISGDPSLRAQQAPAPAQTSANLQRKRPAQTLPPRVLAAQRFLAARGVAAGHRALPRSLALHSLAAASLARTMAARAQNTPGSSGSGSTWTPLGPTAVITPDFGLVTGRVTAIALDPSDATGNHVYIGTTGGGVWSSSNAGTSIVSNIAFSPLTDMVTALGGATDASISIGALTVQPGETGVILAGTGDPNDILDSYYGAGILRSTDGGNTWSLITKTSDLEDGLAANDVDFAGEGFAGFAWSTANPQVVVAAVTESYEGDVVDANQPALNCEGLYYSTDSGATWHLATISDGSGAVVQSAIAPLLGPNGNAATSVVWNPKRGLFIAAVRFHGYYSSPDGITWTRLTDQPSAGLNTTLCPTNKLLPGNEACPVYRGALAVNPQNGDTFAWTVDIDNQDQGVWQDQCAMSGNSCSNATITFAQELNSAQLETSTTQGAATIADGNYNLTLAAIPSGQESMILAGAHDLWSVSCPPTTLCFANWRNTTNSTTCMSAGVAEYQHALAWNAANPEEIFIGGDSGLWRSTDGIAETGAACSSTSIATDATHFENLNGSLGSLAEAESLSLVPTTPYALMAGLGVNGTAGVKSAAVTTDWPQILSGYGGPATIDPNNTNNWYVNDQPGVSIYLCAQSGPCTPSAFGTSPVVTDADVGGDGYTMPVPATFLVEPFPPADLLVATCRVWRGAAGVPWTSANAISPVLDNASSSGPCSGDSLIRSMAAAQLSSGGEVIYVGMYGSATYGSILPGHVLSAVYNPSSGASPTWNDLTLNPVTNDTHAMNYYGLDISSITIDPHDPTGNTVYVTVEGVPNSVEGIRSVYRSTNGGATWTSIASNLPLTAVSSVAIDPQSANTAYVATDVGVYYTAEVANCAQLNSDCWSVFGTGLPAAPAVALSTASVASSTQVLVAATYGRGIWQTPLLTAGTALSAGSVAPGSLTFSNQAFNSTSNAQTVTLLNTGSVALAPTSISFNGNFNKSGDTCTNQTIAPGSSCTILVVFIPQATGPVTGEMTIYANIYGGQITVDLNGTGTAAGSVTLTPSNLDFGQIEQNTVSPTQSITVANGGAAVNISSLTVTAPFVIPALGNACGSTSLAANSDCAIKVEFAPGTIGSFTGLLTLTDGAGTQSVELTGTALAPPTDILNPPTPASLTFSATPEGQTSAAQPVTITNIGGIALTGISISVTGPFQETPNCTSQLAAGSVCTIEVIFVPAQVGSASGTLTITDALKTQTVSLSGTGLAPPVIGVTPTSLTFTNQQPGVASAAQTATIANTGSTPLANIGFAFTGSAASNYSVAATTCGALLNNGGNCTAQIVFTPGALGAIAAALVVSSSTPDVSAVSVPLNGTGLLANGLTTNTTQLSFPVVVAGQSSAAQTVTITNSTSYAIGAITLATSAPFSISQNGCTGSLAAGANCTVSLVFAPILGGAATGTLTVSSSGVATPAVVGLSGTGFDFTVSISGPSSQTVARGQTANYTIVITPAGASGTFSFVCGTLPAGSLCLFNPTSETLNAGVQGNVLVQISTSSSVALMERPGRGWPGPGSTVFGRTLTLACALLFLPLAIRRRRRIFQLALLLAVLICGASSCTGSGGGSGGSGGQGGGSGTPTGTYTVPVTVTADNISQTVDLVLTVD